MHPQIEDQLDEALDALVARGPKSLDELLESFPADSAIRVLLQAAEGARSLLVATPPPQVRARQIAQLMERAGDFRAPQKTWRRRPTSRMRALVLRPIAVLAVFAATMGAPLLELASASAPGEALYGTKLALERMRLGMEWDPLEEVNLHLQFADRRISDLTELLAEGRTDETGRVMASLKAHLGEAEDGVYYLKEVGQPVVSLRAHLNQVLSKHMTVLQDFIAQAGCETSNAVKLRCKGLLNALENSSKVRDTFQGATRWKVGRGRPETAGEGARSGPNQPATPAPEHSAHDDAPPAKSGGPPSNLRGESSH
jgi:hypothetical protein